MMDDRGVSQVVGFVLTFGIIIASIGIVSTVGYDQLNNIRNAEQENNAQRAIELVAQNFDEIQQGQSDVRSGELDLKQGNLRTLPEAQSNIRVQIEENTGLDDTYDETIPMRALVYRTEGASVAYESGAVFRQDRGGTVHSRTPSFVCRDTRALVSVVTVDVPGGERQFGSTTVGVTLQRNESTIRFPFNRTGRNSTQGKSTVTLDVDSEFEEGWTRYLSSSDNGWEQHPSNPDQYVCDGTGSGVEQYRVVQTRVNVTFVR